jgi:hypothetical protein
MHGYYGSEGPDEYYYSILSYDLETHGFLSLVGMGIDSLKYLVFSGTAVFFKIFGASTFTEVLYNIILYGASISMLFLLGRKLHSPQAGLLAALFYSEFPTGINQVASGGDDIAMAFFAILSILLFVYAIKTKNKNLNYTLMFLTGFTASIGILSVAEEILILLPILIALAYFMSKKEGRPYFAKGMLFAIAGILAAIIVILGFGSLAYGKPMYVPMGLLTNYSGGSSTSLLYGFHLYLQYMFPVNGPFENIYLIETGGYFLVFIVTLLIAIAYKDRNASIPALWFISVFLYLSFGTMNLTHYIQIDWGIPLLRYLMVIVPATVLIMGIGLADLVWGKPTKGKRKKASNGNRKKKPYLYIKEATLIILLAFFTISNINYINTIKLSMYSYAYPFYNLGEFIDTLPAGSSIVVAQGFLSGPNFLFLLVPYTDYQYNFTVSSNEINCTTLNRYDYVLSVNKTLQQECNMHPIFTVGPYPTYLRKYDILAQSYSIFSRNSTLLTESYNFTYYVYKARG